jgi:hypothetical protein
LLAQAKQLILTTIRHAKSLSLSPQTPARLNLPNPTGFGPRVLVKKMSSSGTVTVQPPAGVTIDGQWNFSLAAQYKFVELLSDGSGSQWAVIGSN